MGKKIIGSTLLLIVANIANLVTTYGQRAVFAFKFGAGAELDAYWASLIIPNMLMFFFYGIGISAIPVFVRYQEEGRDEDARELLRNTFRVGVITILITLPLMLWQMPLLSYVAAPKMAAGTRALATSLSRLLYPAFFAINGLGILLTCILNNRKRFLVAKYGSVLPQLAVMVAVMTLAGTIGIHAAAWGSLIGFTLQLAIYLMAIDRYMGLKELVRGTFRGGMSFKEEGIRQVIRQSIPVMLTALNIRLMVMVDKIMASAVGVGSLSILSYAFGIAEVPHNLFDQASAVVKGPFLQQYAARKEYDKMMKVIKEMASITLLLICPCMMGLVVLGRPIVTLLFQHGEFTAGDTVQVAYLFGFYALISIPRIIHYCFGRTFIALQKAQMVLKVEIFMAGLSVLLNWILAFKLGMGLAGLVLSTAIASLFTALAMGWQMKRLIKDIRFGIMVAPMVKIIAATLIMGGVCRLVLDRSAPLLKSLPWDMPEVIEILAGSLIGGAAYVLLITFVFKVDEWDELKGRLLGKIGIGGKGKESKQ